MVNKDQTQKRRVVPAAPVVTPKETGNNSGKDESDEENEFDVPSVLEADDRVLVQIANIGDTGLATRLEKHPTDMRPDEAVVSVVRVKVRIGITMMSAVPSRPPLDGPLDGTSSRNSEDILQRLGRVVSTMCPQPVISGGDSKSVKK